MDDIEKLTSLGQTGYRHLKCFEELSCQAAHCLREKYPGLLTLTLDAHHTVARLTARELQLGLLGLHLTEQERARVKSWNEDDLFTLFLGAEEILDHYSPLGCPSWNSDDLSEELERWLSESSQQAAQN